MAQTIKIRRSAVPSKVPTTSDLALGELAVNTYDGKLYLKKDNGVPIVIEVGATGVASVYIGVTAPLAPTAGTLWWNSETGDMLIYYVDANSSQWVSVTSGPAGPSGATTPISTKTANYTITSADHTILANAAAGAIAISLPVASTVTGQVFNIKKIDASPYSVTLDGNGSETIDGSLTAVIYVQYVTLTIQSTGSGWVII